MYKLKNVIILSLAILFSLTQISAQKGLFRTAQASPTSEIIYNTIVQVPILPTNMSVIMEIVPVSQIMFYLNHNGLPTWSMVYNQNTYTHTDALNEIIADVAANGVLDHFCHSKGYSHWAETINNYSVLVAGPDKTEVATNYVQCVIRGKVPPQN